MDILAIKQAPEQPAQIFMEDGKIPVFLREGTISKQAVEKINGLRQAFPEAFIRTGTSMPLLCCSRQETVMDARRASFERGHKTGCH